MSHKNTMIGAIAGFLAGMVFFVGSREIFQAGPGPREAVATQVDELLQPEGQEPPGAINRRTPIVEAVARTAPAVVNITCEAPHQSPFSLFHGRRSTATTQGSGAIIKTDGVVLTNAHVVRGVTSITATLPDDTSFAATVVGFDDDLDLAVLQLEDATDLPTIPLGSSEDLLLGETVIAIGNPFGLGHTVTTGVVSSPNRTLEIAERTYQDYIQTDAGINPGNSGGPLLNINGEMVGINTAIRRDAENIGFAIPVDRAAKVAWDLLQYGSVRAPWLGVAVEDISDRRIPALSKGAVLVTSVDSLGDATQGGLQPGDILLGMDGRSVHSRADLNLRLAGRSPGHKVKVEGIRDGAPFQVALVADALPAEAAPMLVEVVLGIEVQPISSRQAQAAGLHARSGLLVTAMKPDGTFAKAGLRAGDAILAVHGAAVRSGDEIQSALLRAKAAHRGSVLLTVQRGPYRGHVEVGLLGGP